MKVIKTQDIRDIRVVYNGAVHKDRRWAQIQDPQTGEVLHTGQLLYIKRVALKKYGKLVNLS